MKRIIHLLVVFVSISIVGIQAQDVAEENTNEGIKLEERAQQNQTLRSAVQNVDQSMVIINQEGQQNQAYILQSQNAQSGKNFIEVDQQGTSHSVDLDVRGTANGIRIEQKQGMGNIPDLVDAPSKGHRYSGDIYGNENLINIKQTGNGNTINQQATVDYLNMDVHQSGYNNELNLINNTLSAPPIKVQQAGHDMNITIENNVLPISGAGN